MGGCAGFGLGVGVGAEFAAGGRQKLILYKDLANEFSDSSVRGLGVGGESVVGGKGWTALGSFLLFITNLMFGCPKESHLSIILYSVYPSTTSCPYTHPTPLSTHSLLTRCILSARFCGREVRSDTCPDMTPGNMKYE